MRPRIICVVTFAALGLGVAPAAAGQPAAQQLEVNQDNAHRLAAALPADLTRQLAGQWFDAATGKLAVAVTTESAAAQARGWGAEARIVARGKAELDRTDATVRALVGKGVPGVFGWGIDVRANEVVVDVDRTRKTAATESFLSKVPAGVRVTETASTPHQQSGTIQTGNPWWPGGESNCSVGFPVTDPGGAKHFLTAGHCTNDRDQAAYGASGQQNKIGTSNVGGTHSVNALEGDMGVVAVTEAGWNLSAAVNTWGQPAVTLAGAAEAMVGDRVCHSGNTSHWQCGEVKYTHKSVDYGGGLIIDDLTWTTACSLGGDSGGGWLLGDKATGLHDGGPSQCVENPGDGDMSIFQPVGEALAKWQLTLVTGGGSSDTTPPSAPGNPRATSTTANSVSLAWDASTDDVGVTAYDVYNGSAVAATVAGTSATVTGLAPDTAYTFTVKARDAAGNASPASASVVARTQPGGGGRTLTNGTDYPIRDYQQVFSPITSTLTGQAGKSLTVGVTIQHTCAEDLGITLLDPAGKAYPLKYSGGASCTAWSGARTFTVPAANSPAGGRWQLRVTDYGPGDTGVLDTWSLTL